MKETKGLAAVIREYIANHPKADAHKIAKALVKETEEDDLIALIEHEVSIIRRSKVREAEKKAFNTFFKVDERIEDSEERVANLQRVYTERFSIGRKQSIEWGKATIEQHQIRIAMLTKLREGIGETIDRHQQAITMIEQAGVSCLDEVEAAA